MVKTPLRSKYLRGLADLNDQFCFFLFASDELARGVGRLGDAAHQLYLPDIFADNEYAPRINIRVGDIEQFEAERDRFTFGSYVSTSYEFASSFLADATSLLRSANSSFRAANGDSPESRYWNTLSSSSCTTPPDEVKRTLEYIRLRRNVFIHLDSSPSPRLSNLITDHGSALNAYWTGSVQELDFTSTDVTTFQERESVDLLLLLRVVVETLDDHLATQLDQAGVIQLAAENAFGATPSRMNDAVAADRIKKLRGLILQQYGGSCSDTELDPVVRSVGIRGT